MTKVSAAAALEAVLEGILNTLKKARKCGWWDSAPSRCVSAPPEKGRNPATGKEIKIAASRNARFKPGAALKASLNKKSAKK